MHLSLPRLLMAALASDAKGYVPTTGSLLGRKAMLENYRVILASQSPRRKEIFDLMGLKGNYEVIVSGFPENLDKAEFAGPGGPARYAETNAVCKAREVASRNFVKRAKTEGEGAEVEAQPVVVVGSDTIVDLDGQILEKPKDAEEAKATLRRLSGRAHLVHSGVGIFTSDTGCEEPAVSFSETTFVRFGVLSEEEITNYVDSGEPMDKAGSYGIQGLGGQFVDGIEGCYFNVMGFPMRRFSSAISALLST